MIKSNQILFELELDKYVEYKTFFEEGEFGVEINDFCNSNLLCDKIMHENRVLDYKKIIQNYKNRIITLHGAFYGLVIHSKDPDIAEISRKKIIKSVQTAVELSCRKVIFHSGIVPQSIGNAMDSIVEIHCDFWSELLQRHKNIEICIENVWEAGPDFFENLFKKINNSRFTMCIDNGHANVYSNCSITEWNNRLLPYISHIHLSDNDTKVRSSPWAWRWAAEH